MFDDSAIVRFYSYIDGSCKLMRVKYSCDENGVVTLGNVNEVHITYEDVPADIEETGVEQTTQMETTEQVSIDNTESIENQSNTVKTEVQETMTEQVIENTECNCEVDAACADSAVDAAQVTNAEVAETNEKVSVDNEQAQEDNSGATSFAESERAELEALKREKKINLLNSYKDYLTDKEYADFQSNIDTFEVNTLEVELLKKYKTYTEGVPHNTMRAFALVSPKNENARDTLDDFVSRNLSR